VNAGQMNAKKTIFYKDSTEPGERGRGLEIIQAAAHLFHEKGFHATSMNDIANAMNLTKPGLYHYVESKEELLYAIIDYAMCLLQEVVIKPAKAIQNPRQRLDFIIERHALLVVSNKVIVILTDDLSGLSADHHEVVIQHKRKFFQLLRSTLEELGAAGNTRALNSTVVAFSIFGALLWLPRWFNPSGELTPEAIINEVKGLIYRGIENLPSPTNGVTTIESSGSD
jgi:AcrR family transcriptional regulator